MNRILKTGVLAVIGGTTLAACSDRLTVPNFQSPTVESISSDPIAAIPLLATGVMRDDRGNLPGYVLGTGILGREAYNYTPTEGRNTTGWLTSDVSNNTSFGGTALWSGPYFTVRDAFNTLAVIDASGAVFTDAQKSAMKGLMHTEVALSLLYVVNTRDDLGAPVEVYADPAKQAPFVSRDSVFAFIAGTLNQAQTELTAAGSTAFPFTLPSGFAGFTTPATFIKFNRALAARVAAYRASLGTSGCAPKLSAACYQTALTALSASFMDASGSLTSGVFNVYSAAAGDVANSNSNQATTNVVAHAKWDQGVQNKADGTPDARFTAKITKLASPKQPPNGLGLASSFDFTQPALRTDPIAIIRNEELILLRAEARYFTGDKQGALDDINLIRTKSGGLAARTAFTSDSDFTDELLYNRRFSLAFEGHRWVDLRRFGKLSTLPLDLPTHVVVSRLPVPQAECLSRANADASLKGPGC